MMYKNINGYRLYKAIENNNIIKRYQSVSHVDLLSSWKLKEKLEKFSWGELYANIKLNNNQEILVDEVKLFQEALNIELLMLAVELLDNVCDDELDSNNLNIANTTLLVSELICSTLRVIMNIEGYSLVHKYIQKAQIGQWYDININAFSEDTCEKIYFEKVINKSICLFQFLTILADVANVDFWKEFSVQYATYLQISNDLNDVMTKNKTDRTKLRPTLPLIKLKELKDNFTPIEELQHLFYDTSLSAMKEQFKLLQESGVLEYCDMLQLKYRKNSIKLLQKQFDNSQMIKNFKL
jgi:hypothetical protein